MTIKNYAFIDDTNIVRMVMPWIEEQIAQDFPAYTAIEISEETMATTYPGWRYVDGQILPPLPPPPPTPQEQIYQLENACNSQRLREHILGINTTWLPQNEAQIAALRAQIPAPAGKSSK